MVPGNHLAEREHYRIRHRTADQKQTPRLVTDVKVTPECVCLCWGGGAGGTDSLRHKGEGLGFGPIPGRVNILQKAD